MSDDKCDDLLTIKSVTPFFNYLLRNSRHAFILIIVNYNTNNLFSTKFSEIYRLLTTDYEFINSTLQQLCKQYSKLRSAVTEISFSHGLISIEHV